MCFAGLIWLVGLQVSSLLWGRGGGGGVLDLGCVLHTVHVLCTLYPLCRNRNVLWAFGIGRFGVPVWFIRMVFGLIWLVG